MIPLKSCSNHLLILQDAFKDGEKTDFVLSLGVYLGCVVAWGTYLPIKIRNRVSSHLNHSFNVGECGCGIKIF